MDPHPRRRPLKRARAAAVIHFAGHGTFREDNPLFSSLRFHDGELLFLDLEDLRLRADLVVLSACRTGNARGELHLGTGLSRGFLRAGARNLVVSLWPVGDEAARRVMGGFYRAYAAGNPPAEALRRAGLAARAEGAHPADWASFQVVGVGVGEESLV